MCFNQNWRFQVKSSNETEESYHNAKAETPSFDLPAQLETNQRAYTVNID